MTGGRIWIEYWKKWRGRGMPANRKPNTTPEKKPKPTMQELLLADERYEKSHGKIVKNREQAREGMRLLLDVYMGKMSFEEYERHWAKVCALYRK